MVSSENNNPSTSAQHPNKWLKWYYNLCETRKGRGVLKEKGFHIHHIIPKCDGGDDSKENKVKLTSREHFIAHVLLAKGTNSVKHWFTVRRMIGVKKAGKGAIEYQPRLSILYTSLQKEAFSKAPGGAEKGRPKSKAMREKLSASKKGKPLPSATLAKAHKANRERKIPEEERERRSQAAKRYWSDKERSSQHRSTIGALLSKRRRGEDIV